MLNLYPATPGGLRAWLETTAPIGPCWTCTWWRGLNARSGARCGRPGAVPTKVDAERGCAFFTREPGCDDEPWTPPGWQPLARQDGPWVTGTAAEPRDPTAPL